ncbi:hypothetical protein ACGFZ9_47515 [Streptomyces mirabilis]|uniref:hypothetical protein n=1 Tax=Streptomyces mirabilis TaxID=68239 RepID=UPI00372106E4
MTSAACGALALWSGVLGLCVVFLEAVFSGVWLVPIGWFVIASATAESGQATLQVLLRGVPVREGMTANPLVAAADTTVVGFLADPAFRYRHSAFPITDKMPWGADRMWGASDPVPTDVPAHGPAAKPEGAWRRGNNDGADPRQGRRRRRTSVVV